MKDQIPGLNPFLPFGTYIPDGEPKVFGDRLYLYGSYDRFDCGYCSREYHVVSAPLADLTAWTDHGVSFSTDAVPWSNADLYAPDALYHNGKYYLFFCLSDGTEGVAESASPIGPFTNARQITLNGELYDVGGRLEGTSHHKTASCLEPDFFQREKATFAVFKRKICRMKLSVVSRCRGFVPQKVAVSPCFKKSTVTFLRFFAN